MGKLGIAERDRQIAAMAFDECDVVAFIMRQYSLEMSKILILTGIPVNVLLDIF